MRTNMVVDVEFIAGTSIHSAVEEAKSKAIAWNVAYIQFKFNGVSMCISKSADVEEACLKFSKVLKDKKSNSKYVVE